MSLIYLSFLFGLATLLSGCQSPITPLQPCPLSATEQREEILALIPLGTPREEAITRLTAAGIEGKFSQATQSIYYCDQWDRQIHGSSPERWHLQVAVLFDKEKTVYEVRTTNAVTGTLLPADADADVETSPLRTGKPITPTQTEIFPAEQIRPAAPASENSAPPSSRNSSRTGRRSPF